MTHSGRQSEGRDCYNWVFHCGVMGVVLPSAPDIGVKRRPAKAQSSVTLENDEVKE
jgi:hypothetical protein